MMQFCCPRVLNNDKEDLFVNGVKSKRPARAVLIPSNSNESMFDNIFIIGKNRDNVLIESTLLNFEWIAKACVKLFVVKIGVSFKSTKLTHLFDARRAAEKFKMRTGNDGVFM